MTATPSLSVIIPVYNDPDGLRNTLESVVAQDYPTDDYEVLPVDNGSTDRTPVIIANYESAYPDLVTGIEESEIQGSYAARNAGIREAEGEIVCLIDADMTVEDTWLSSIRDRFVETDVDYLGYCVDVFVPDGENSFWARYDVAMGLPVEHYMKTKQFAPTCALAVRKSVFKDVGLFDDELRSGGDKEFGIRVRRAGLVMSYDPEIVARHPARTTFSSLWKKAVRIGKGQTDLWNKYRIGSHPISPLRVLPPSPTRVSSRKRAKAPFISIYLVEIILKWVQLFSGAIHWGFHKDK